MKKQLLQTICFVVFSVTLNTILFAQNTPSSIIRSRKATETSKIPGFNHPLQLGEEQPFPPKSLFQKTSSTSSFRTDSSLGYRWDTLLNAWLVDYKSFVNYDAKGNLTNELYLTWKSTNWVNSGQYTYTYDANGKETSELYQTWEGTVWVNTWQYVHTYDAKGNEISWLSQRWNGTALVNYSQSTNTYDANGNKTSGLGQYWNDTIWVNSSQTTYTYDANGNETSFLIQRWNGITLVNDGQSTSTYDAKGNQTRFLYQKWDGTYWVNNYQFTYTYDTKGNQTSYLYQKWDSTVWVNEEQSTSIYDANGKKTSGLSQDWNGVTWVNFLQNTFTYDDNGNLAIRVYWYFSYPEHSDSCLYYWSGTAGIAESAVGSGRVSIYPNPSNDKLIIKTQNSEHGIFEMFDVAGSVILQNVIQNSQSSISISYLYSGIYFYKFTDEKGRTARGKVIIVK